MTLSHEHTGFPRVGIVGGGQLGKMLAQPAKRMGLHVTVLDPTPGCPAFSAADAQIVADYKDEKAIARLGEACDYLTFEIELANSRILKQLHENGVKVNPNPNTLYIIQSKLRQKTFLQEQGLPVAAFHSVSDLDELKKSAKDFNHKAMLKMSQDSYDGRGNIVLNDHTNWEDVWSKLQGKEALVEEWIPFEKELSVMVARNERGEVATYPVAENIHVDSILDTTIAPARVSDDIARRAQKVAREAVEKLQGSGVFGVELFLTKEGEILINEIAPRVHNSGHFTIEACKTSQFEQHIRAVLNWPLGKTEQVHPAVMVNILGKTNGPFTLKGMNKIFEIDGAHPHVYGKREARPQRKMGHVTIIDDDLNSAMVKAERVKKIINGSM